MRDAMMNFLGAQVPCPEPGRGARVRIIGPGGEWSDAMPYRTNLELPDGA